MKYLIIIIKKIHIVLILFTKKYNIRHFDLERKYRLVNNEKLIFKFNKLDCDNFK